MTVMHCSNYICDYAPICMSLKLSNDDFNFRAVKDEMKESNSDNDFSICRRCGDYSKQ